MTAVTAWAASVCVCTAVCLLAEFLSVNGPMEKLLRFVMGIFMLCCTVLPLQNLANGINEQLKSINIESNIYEDFEEDAEKYSENITKTSVISVIENKLKKIDCTPQNIELEIAESGKISLVKITVDKSYKDEIFKIKATVEEAFKLNTKVIIA